MDSEKELSEVDTGELKLKLEKPLTMSKSEDSKYVHLTNCRLGIWTFGETYEEAVESFKEYFRFLYEAYYLEDDEGLGEIAMRIKKRIGELSPTEVEA